MRVRRLLCLLWGLWLGGCFFMTLVATQNFRSVDRLLAHPAPEAAQQIKALGGPENARQFLRHAAAEQNRWFFETWEVGQLVLGSGIFLTLLFASAEGKYTLLVALVAIGVVALQRFFLTPEIVAAGRTLDFVPLGMMAGEHRRFWILHGMYSGVELFKWALIVALAGRFLFQRRRRSGDVRQKVDVVDITDHRHVNG